MPDLCVIILTFNEERNIGPCLDSLLGLNVPVFVLDSFSADRTLEILEKYPVKFAQHPFENYAQQRNTAQQICPFETEWVLHLDAGERLTPELASWLKNEFKPESPADGYLFSRRTIFMDRWIRYGGHYPSYHLRLFRREKGRCEAKAYDQHFVVEGPVQKATSGADIIDYVCNSLSEFTAKHNRWAQVEAKEQTLAIGNKGEVNARLNGTAIERRRWFKNRIFGRSPLFLRAFLYFLYRYFFRLGFLDGRPGLIFHFLQGCWFRFLIDAMIYEQRQKQNPD